jgi:TolB-like protein
MTLKFYRITGIALLYASGVLAQLDTNRSIAVYSIKGIDIPDNLAASLQEHLESKLINCNTYQVISRSDMDKIMAENAFQSTGTCLDQSCLLRAGHILGVREIITGTISKVGQTYNIVLKLINVESGAIKSSVNQQQYAGTVDSLLHTAEKALGRLLDVKANVPMVKVDTLVRIDTMRTIAVVHSTDTVWRVKEIPIRQMPSEESDRTDVKRIDNPALARKMGIGAGLIFAGLALVILINTNL